MRGQSTSLLLLLLVLGITHFSPSTVVAADDVDETKDNEECGMYLAVSSTSTVEDPKWGVYAGKAYDKGVQLGAGDLAVQVLNLLGSVLTGNNEEDPYEAYLVSVVEFFEQFLWVPLSSAATNELDHGRIVSAIPGVGVVGAYNPKLTNADWNHSTAYFRPAWNEEPNVAHPGRGAYSNFFDVSIKSVERIPAGMEIFMNYGDNWEENEDDEEDSDEITRSDHEKIDETVAKMLDFFDKHRDELDETAKADIYNFLVRDVMAAAAGPKKGAKITAMLPPTPEELQQIKDVGGSLTFSQPTTVRPIEWLKNYGRCMDNIRPGPSTIPHAGRGAFANRGIAAGGLVAPSPMIHIASEDILEMRRVKHVHDPEDPDRYVRSDDEVFGSQLLMNYLYAHPESKMMFFPAGAYVGLINHSKEPNAKMVWSSHPNNHKHWFDLSPGELLDPENQHLGLLMEIVATRDIAEGEEVFIDYGPNWQGAWDEHVSEWEKLIEAGRIQNPWPVRALDLNEEYRSKPMKTQTEQEGSPYPSNVAVKCFLMVKKPEDEPPINDNGQKVRTWSDPDTVKRSAIDSDNLFDCPIVDRDEADDSWIYSVLWSNEKGTTLVKKVPHKAIVFVDKPGTSDQFFSHGFRHWIGIPDDIFPQGPWRDVVEMGEEEQ